MDRRVKIVYNSFQGRFSDSPRALYEALTLGGVLAGLRPGEEPASHTWLASPHRLREFPAGVRTVTPSGPDCVAALEEADLVIANTYTEVPWRKPATTRYLQLWHGTPLKRIHFDVPSSVAGHLEALQDDLDRWDLLVSPNAASTGILRRAFGFRGEVLETGYPRNDLLSAPDRAQLRAKVRAELGLDDDTTAVLYTPTWRDGVDFDSSRAALGLDVDALLAELGPGHCLLLRLHYLVPASLVPEPGPQLRDVTDHPDIAELYLAADVLVTDYSSTMFDFAVTGKPMVFFTHDLDHYRDTVRGFYLDFEAQAPGPLVRTGAELAQALRTLTDVQERYAERYSAFRRTYTHLEDGQATDRVLSAILPQLAAAQR